MNFNDLTTEDFKYNLRLFSRRNKKYLNDKEKIIFAAIVKSFKNKGVISEKGLAWMLYVDKHSEAVLNKKNNTK